MLVKTTEVRPKGDSATHQKYQVSDNLQQTVRQKEGRLRWDLAGDAKLFYYTSNQAYLAGSKEERMKTIAVGMLEYTQRCYNKCTVTIIIHMTQ